MGFYNGYGYTGVFYTSSARGQQITLCSENIFCAWEQTVHLLTEGTDVLLFSITFMAVCARWASLDLTVQ